MTDTIVGALNVQIDELNDTYFKDDSVTGINTECIPLNIADYLVNILESRYGGGKPKDDSFQRRINQTVGEVDYARHLQKVKNGFDAARVVSQKNPGAMIHTSTAPADHGLTLDANDMQSRLKDTLGIDRRGEGGVCPFCDNTVDAMHHHNCKMDGVRTTEHNKIVEVISEAFKDCCPWAKVIHEPTKILNIGSTQAKLQRPDLFIQNLPLKVSKPLMIDFTIASIGRVDLLSLTQQEPLYAAREAEIAKVINNRYQAGCEQMGYTFLPAAMESTGAFGPGMIKIIALLRKLCKYNGDDDSGALDDRMGPTTPSTSRGTDHSGWLAKNKADYWAKRIAAEFARARAVTIRHLLDRIHNYDSCIHLSQGSAQRAFFAAEDLVQHAKRHQKNKELKRIKRENEDLRKELQARGGAQNRASGELITDQDMCGDYSSNTPDEGASDENHRVEVSNNTNGIINDPTSKMSDVRPVIDAPSAPLPNNVPGRDSVSQHKHINQHPCSGVCGGDRDASHDAKGSLAKFGGLTLLQDLQRCSISTTQQEATVQVRGNGVGRPTVATDAILGTSILQGAVRGVGSAAHVRGGGGQVQGPQAYRQDVAAHERQQEAVTPKYTRAETLNKSESSNEPRINADRQSNSARSHADTEMAVYPSGADPSQADGTIHSASIRAREQFKERSVLAPGSEYSLMPASLSHTSSESELVHEWIREADTEQQTTGPGGGHVSIDNVSMSVKWGRKQHVSQNGQQETVPSVHNSMLTLNTTESSNESRIYADGRTNHARSSADTKRAVDTSDAEHLHAGRAASNTRNRVQTHTIARSVSAKESEQNADCTDQSAIQNSVDGRGFVDNDHIGQSLCNRPDDVRIVSTNRVGKEQIRTPPQSSSPVSGLFLHSDLREISSGNGQIVGDSVNEKQEKENRSLPATMGRTDTENTHIQATGTKSSSAFSTWDREVSGVGAGEATRNAQVVTSSFSGVEAVSSMTSHGRGCATEDRNDGDDFNRD